VREERCRFAEHCGIGNRVSGLSFGIPRGISREETHCRAAAAWGRGDAVREGSKEGVQRGRIAAAQPAAAAEQDGADGSSGGGGAGGGGGGDMGEDEEDPL